MIALAPAFLDVRRRALAASLLLLGLALTPGCLDGPDGPDDGDDGTDGTDGNDRYTYEDCSSTTLSRDVNGTTWHAASISCDANVTGTNSQQVPCGTPNEAELTVAANLTSGAVQIRVQDGADETIVDRRISDTDGEPRNLAIPDGEEGNWTLAGERLEGYEGSFQSELACPE